MKRILFTSALLLTAITLRAQTKTPESKPLKPTYRKVVVIPVEDYQSIIGAVKDLQSANMYNPNLTGDQKTQQFATIDAYLKELPSRVKLDSVKVGEGK